MKAFQDVSIPPSSLFFRSHWPGLDHHVQKSKEGLGIQYVCKLRSTFIEWEVGSAMLEEGMVMTIDHIALGIDVHLL